MVAKAPYGCFSDHAARRPGGQGRETSRDPSAQKRHGRSAALVIPIADARHVGQRVPREDLDRAGHERRVVLAQLDPQRLGELARAVGQPGRRTAPRAHQLLTPQRLQGADQDRRAHALGLADRVQQRVDAVGAVDVRDPGRTEEDVGARRQTHVGMARRLAEVIGLGLHDPAGGVAVHDHAAQQGRVPPRAPAGRRRTPLGRRVQRGPGVGELLAHPRQRRPALALLGLEPRPLG